MLKLSRNLSVMILCYVAAGTNHFLNPNFYMPLIPAYLPFHGAINTTSGIIEISFALLLIPNFTRKGAAFGIIMMLIAFIPAHIYFIQQNSCAGELCVPSWVGWVRLCIIQPILIYWAWSNRNS